MVIYMRHKIHGNKVATSEEEAKYDEKSGWERYEVPAILKPAPVEKVPDEPVSDEKNALISQYVERFGKKPHHKKSEETIKKELEAA